MESSRSLDIVLTKKSEETTMTTSILSLGKQSLINLDPKDFLRPISLEEVFHILKTFDKLWLYNYQALREGKKGWHAKLKSELCGDGFINFKDVLKQHPNIRRVLAYQLFLLINEKIRSGMLRPTHIAGVPSAATELGEDVANMLGLPVAKAEKDAEGNIIFLDSLSSKDLLLLVEDLCTKATGIKETINNAVSRGMVDINRIIPEEIVILSRGGLRCFQAAGRRFAVNAAFEYRLHEWMPLNADDKLRKKFPGAEPCQLCAQGVPRDKPKKDEETWRKRFINGQH